MRVAKVNQNKVKKVEFWAVDPKQWAERRKNALKSQVTHIELKKKKVFFMQARVV